jgi:hypothetical protein
LTTSTCEFINRSAPRNNLLQRFHAQKALYFAAVPLLELLSQRGNRLVLGSLQRLHCLANSLTAPHS